MIKTYYVFQTIHDDETKWIQLLRDFITLFSHFNCLWNSVRHRFTQSKILNRFPCTSVMPSTIFLLFTFLSEWYCFLINLALDYYYRTRNFYYLISFCFQLEILKIEFTNDGTAIIWYKISGLSIGKIRRPWINTWFKLTRLNFSHI